MSFLSAPPIRSPLTQAGDEPSRPWMDWFSEAQRYGKKYRGNGTTANRPTNALETADWYFDTTLGKPIWYSGSGWVDATGAAV